MIEKYRVELGGQFLNAVFDSSPTFFVLAVNQTGPSSPLHVTMTRDNTLTLTFTATYFATGLPVNLTGCTISVLFKNNLNDANNLAVITKSIGGGITITNAPGGVFTVSLITGDTSALTVQTILYFDALITDGSGDVFTVGAGSTLQVDLNATRP